MKGIVLAGDSGSKLYPLTLGVPKQLLPVYDRPMIFYPLETLAQIGIKEVLVITTEEHQEAFKKTLGAGETFGLNLTYAVQERPEGVAQALTIARDFACGDSIVLTTGDCLLFGEGLTEKFKKAIRTVERSGNATIFVSSQNDAEQFGIAIPNDKRKCKSLQDEPLKTGMYYSVTGIYFYPNIAIDIASKIEPSERGKLEITSVNEHFHQKGKLQMEILNEKFGWLDTNTIENLFKASVAISKKKIKN